MHKTFDKVYSDVVYRNTLMVCTVVDSGAPGKAKVNVQERGGSRHSSPSGEEQLSLERDSPLRATSTTEMKQWHEVMASVALQRSLMACHMCRV